MWHKPCRTFHPWCPYIKTRCLFVQFGLLNSVAPGDATWCHRTWSTLVHIKACCLLAQVHYLSHWGFITSEVLWCSWIHLRAVLLEKPNKIYLKNLNYDHISQGPKSKKPLSAIPVNQILSILCLQMSQHLTMLGHQQTHCWLPRYTYNQTSNNRCTKFQNLFLVLSCSCLCPIHWNQVLSWEWICR